MEQRICLTLEYDGSRYQGWQRQNGLATIQGEVEAALVRVTGESPDTLKVAVAGRTDAGVHATGQLCAFVCRDGREPRRFAPALNHFLPLDIRVHEARGVDLGFDVRRVSCAKWYSYAIYLGGHASALLQHRAWHLRRHLDTAAMERAAALMVGEHDFESFRSAHCDAAHARRCLLAVKISQAPYPPLAQVVTVDLWGNAFCRHMCRILVGTLAEVGYGERAAEDVLRIFAARDRQAAGITAPPQGLCLRQIYRPEDGVVRPWAQA